MMIPAMIGSSWGLGLLQCGTWKLEVTTPCEPESVTVRSEARVMHGFIFISMGTTNVASLGSAQKVML
jgi:hypothetical protein